MTETPIIDVHCHLSSERFEEDIEAVLARAAEAGVRRMISMGENAADNQRVLSLAERYPAIAVGLGHYPAYLDDAEADRNEALIRDAHAAGRLVAIGEVGIDHWLAKEPEERAHQHAIFRRFVALSQELDVPLSVHSRSAGHHALALLIEAGARRVCMHAFDGRAKYAREAAEAGYYLSVPPSLVRSKQKQKLLRAIPPDKLLLESDAPVLGPDRDQRNEPAAIQPTVALMAQFTGRDKGDILARCLDNTRTLFGPNIFAE